MEVAFFPALFAWAFFFLQSLWQKTLRFSWRELLLFVPCGLVGVTIFDASYQLAIKQCGTALASVLLYTAPVWVVVWGHLLLKEKPVPAKIFALIFAISGVVLVSGEGRISLNPLGFFFGLLSGFSYALYYLIGKSFLTAYPTSYVFSYAHLVGSFGLLPFVRVQERRILWPGGPSFFLASSPPPGLTPRTLRGSASRGFASGALGRPGARSGHRGGPFLAGGSVLCPFLLWVWGSSSSPQPWGQWKDGIAQGEMGTYSTSGRCGMPLEAEVERRRTTIKPASARIARLRGESVQAEVRICVERPALLPSSRKAT